MGMNPSHVLVPLDGSPLADDALIHALATFDCRVTVLNVITPMDANMSEGGILDPGEDRREAARERADQLVDRAREQAATEGRTVETAVRSGDPAETILEFLEQAGADHIVMGAHGSDRGALARRLLGTVSTVVVGESPVTVTVVK